MEKSSSIIILFLFFVTIIHLLAVTSIKVRTIQAEMDYYQLVQHWPGTMEDTDEQTEQPTTSIASKGVKPKTKNKQQKQKNPKAGGSKNPKKPGLKSDRVENFGIHGLWPQYFNGDPYPEFCLKQDGGLPEHYNFLKIKDLYDELKKHWHSLASPYEDGHAVKTANRFGQGSKVKEGIWEHEWDKHGTCSTFENQLKYFGAALELKNRIDNLLEILYDQEIIADGSLYPWDRIKDALLDKIEVRSAKGKDKVKVMPIIECNNKNELYQIHICFTKEDLEPMDCIGSPILVCDKSKEIVFPSFPKKVIDEHKEL